jgi:hypothetical protein
MTRYASGRRKEWHAVALLKSFGWLAQRSAGSRGLWDVIAAKRGQRPRFIQCKYTALIGPNGSSQPPAGVCDKNTKALLDLEGNDETPIDVELWVYHRGRKMPVVYVRWNGDWVFDGSAWAK